MVESNAMLALMEAGFTGGKPPPASLPPDAEAELLRILDDQQPVGPRACRECLALSRLYPLYMGIFGSVWS